VDKTLVCRDCGQSFTFTAGEQEFYSSRGYTEPQRCADCRAAKKVPFVPTGDRPVYCSDCFSQMGGGSRGGGSRGGGSRRY
jgi:CxxC-x17-CxxC domain-containing protein